MLKTLRLNVYLAICNRVKTVSWGIYSSIQISQWQSLQHCSQCRNKISIYIVVYNTSCDSCTCFYLSLSFSSSSSNALWLKKSSSSLTCKNHIYGSEYLVWYRVVTRVCQYDDPYHNTWYRVVTSIADNAGYIINATSSTALTSGM